MSPPLDYNTTFESPEFPRELACPQAEKSPAGSVTDAEIKATWCFCAGGGLEAVSRGTERRQITATSSPKEARVLSTSLK
jgi:hypothetical protein